MAETDITESTRRRRCQSILCSAAFALVGLSTLPSRAHAATITIDSSSPGASRDGILDGFPGLAVLDGTGDLGGNALAVASKDGVTAERAIIELPLVPLAGIAPSAVTTATLTFNVDDVLSTFGPGTDFDGTASETIHVFTYSGNGSVTTTDFNSGSLLTIVQVGAGVTDATLAQSGPLRFTVDVRSSLQSLLTAGATHLGIELATADSPTGTSVDDLGIGGGGPPGSGGATLPFLTITTAEATPTPAPTPTPIPTMGPPGPTPTRTPTPPTPSTTASPSMPTPTQPSTTTPTPRPGVPTPTAAPQTPGGGATPTPGGATPGGGSPTPQSSAGSPTSGPSGGAPTPVGPTPAASPGSSVTPSPAGPTPGSSVTPAPTPGGGATPTPTPVRGPTPAITISGRPRPQSTPLRTSQAAPDGTGDQLIFYFDARERFRSFLNLTNLSEDDLTVSVLFHGAALAAEPLEQTVALAARTTRTIDVGSLRSDGLPAEAGIAFATAVDAAGGPIVSRALGGNFTVANLTAASAWGAHAAARSAVEIGAAGVSLPPLGTPIDGDGVRLRRIQPERLGLAVFYDPAALQPAEAGGNQLIFLSFDDVPGDVFAAAPAATTWALEATRSDGTSVVADPFTTSGVVVSHLEALLGDEVAGASGSLQLSAAASRATNRLAFFTEALGSFGHGYLMPPAP